MKNRHKIVPSSYLIAIKNNRILLARRCNTGFEDGNYSFVAGHVEQGETAKEALVREAKEESGLKVKISDLKLVHIMHRKGPNNERVDFFFKAQKWQGEPKIMELDRCDDMDWFDLDNLPSNTIDYIKKAIKHIGQKQIYSEFGWKGQNEKR